MTIKRLALLLLVVLALTASPIHAGNRPQAQNPLPADLLFATSTIEGQRQIVQVDADTLELSLFYVDDEADELMPLSWSPNGDLLVIYRLLPPIDDASTLLPRQLCILNREGVLQRCLDDRPPMHYVGFPIEWQNYYPVVWGPDGETIYFDTEYPSEESPNDYGRRLVEASVLTGKTLRIVYDYPDAFSVTPSPDLKHIAVGFGEEWRENHPVYISDLTAQTQLDLFDLVPDLTWPFWGCLPFSPTGNYFTAIAKYDLFQYAPELEAPADQVGEAPSILVLLDPEGNIRHIVGEPEGSPATMWYHYCPSWQPDEQAIVFYALNDERDAIMRYSLADQQTTTLYEVSTGYGNLAHSPLVPSPDGQYIALTIRTYDPYGEHRQVAVLYPDGQIRRIDSPYPLTLYPLWVPPLAE